MKSRNLFISMILFPIYCLASEESQILELISPSMNWQLILTDPQMQEVKDLLKDEKEVRDSIHVRINEIAPIIHLFEKARECVQPSKTARSQHLIDIAWFIWCRQSRIMRHGNFAIDDSGNTLLQYAVSKDDKDLFARILECSLVDLNMTNNLGHSPLYTVVEKSQFSFVIPLIEKGVRIFTLADHDQRAFDRLLAEDRIADYSRLVHAQLFVYQLSEKSQESLFSIIRNLIIIHEDIEHLITDSTAFSNEQLFQLLRTAIKFWNVEALEWLCIRYNQQIRQIVNMPGERQNTLLHDVCELSEPNLGRVRVRLSESPEHFEGLQELVQILKKCCELKDRRGQQDPEIQARFRDRRLQVRIERLLELAQFEMAKLLIDLGASIELINENHDTIVHLLAKTHNLKLFWFLDRKVMSASRSLPSATWLAGSISMDPRFLFTTLRDSKGPFFLDLEPLYPIKELLDLKNRQGNLPLHLLLMQPKSLARDRLIFEFSRDKSRIFMPNNDGDTAMHLAARANDIETVKLLYRFFAADFSLNLLTQNSRGNTPIHEAAICGNPDIINFLLLKVPSIPLPLHPRRNHEGFLPVHLAAQIGSVEAVQCFDEQFALTAQGESCIPIAVNGGHLNLLIYLVRQLQQNKAAKSAVQISGNNELINLFRKAFDAASEYKWAIIRYLLSENANDLFAGHLHDVRRTRALAVAREHNAPSDIMKLLSDNVEHNPAA